MDPVKDIQDALGKFFQDKTSEFSYDVSPTTDLRHGDLTTNAAMASIAQLHEEYSSQRELAEEIVSFFNSQKDITQLFARIEIAGPGFINFWYSKQFLEDQLENLAHNTSLHLSNSSYKDKKVMVEFTDPNPFKEFHIGHLYSNIVGESLSRILEANGAEVRRVNYQGDVGLHVAKALWGVEQKIQDAGFTIQDLGKKPLEERVKFLGEAYALGATSYEEKEQAKQEIIEINKKVFEHDPEILSLYKEGREWSLEYFDTIYQRLGTEFWKLYFESEVGERGKKIVEESVEKGIFERSEGAVIFPGEKHGLHNRVFINSLGLPTYEAKELGLAPAKHDDYPYDLSIIVTGNEINEYFKVLLKALSLIYPELAEKTRHISHGMIRLPSGKMSSRTGDVVTGESILDEAHRRAIDRITEVKDKSGLEKVSDREITQTAEIIGIGAVKYALLKQGIGHDVIFNFDEVVSFEGNSGPYLQYSFVRIRSILEKSKITHSTGSTSNVAGAGQVEQEEEDLLRALMLYPIVVKQAGENFLPSGIATYLYDLSQLFNSFYQKHKVIGGEQEEFRIALCQAFGNVVKDGLWLLGIETVGKM